MNLLSLSARNVVRAPSVICQTRLTFSVNRLSKLSVPRVNTDRQRPARLHLCAPDRIFSTPSLAGVSLTFASSFLLLLLLFVMSFHGFFEGNATATVMSGFPLQHQCAHTRALRIHLKAANSPAAPLSLAFPNIRTRVFRTLHFNLIVVDIFSASGGCCRSTAARERLNNTRL